MLPYWLSWLARASLFFGVVSAGIIATDEVWHPQKMRIMNVVWPLTALFGSLVLLWFYWTRGRSAPGSQSGGDFPVSVAKGALHCGAGCSLGDIIAESLLAAVPALATVFGFGWLFGDRIFASWVLDYILAFGIGIVFQYFAIVPMKKLAPREGLIAALKADALSLSAWQLGMYGFMALAHFWIFPALLGTTLEPMSISFWFMMQIAMLCGFVTAYPVNWWLITAGIKEKM